MGFGAAAQAKPCGQFCLHDTSTQEGGGVRPIEESGLVGPCEKKPFRDSVCPIRLILAEYRRQPTFLSLSVCL